MSLLRLVILFVSPMFLMCRRCLNACVKEMPLAVHFVTLPCLNLASNVVGLINFHILFFIPKHDDDKFVDCLSLEKIMFDEVLSEWKRNVGTRKNPVYQPLCTYVSKFVRGKLRSNFDLHYVNPVISDGGTADVAFYVMKYMMKPSDRAVRLQRALRLNLPSDEYDDLWSIVRPRHFESEALGLGQCVYDVDSARRLHRRHYEVAKPILEHLRTGVDLSKHQPGEPTPSYFSLQDGKSHPLAKYYKGNGDIFNMSDFLDFFYASKKVGEDNVIVHDDWSLPQRLEQEKNFDEKVSNVDFQQSALELDDLFDSSDDDFIDLF